MRGVVVPDAVLAGLFVYPLKSAAGISLGRAPIGARGIADDRRWMVVDAGGQFISQRTHPRMALVRVRFATDGVLVSAPGFPDLALPRVPHGGSARSVAVWGDTVAAPSVGAGAAEWMSAHLGCRCDVVYLPDDAARVVEPGWGPSRLLSFADAFPFLLISEESLADLNSRLAVPLPMNRFRPNLVVSGCGPYGEDSWMRIAIGELCFVAARPCSRCATTVVDQDTGERGREPLATLAGYRRTGNEVFFGQNLVHEDEGELTLGDPVVLLDARPA